MPKDNLDAIREKDRKIAEAIMKIMRGEAKPYRFGRTNDAGDSPRYRADMIDAGRGRLLK